MNTFEAEVERRFGVIPNFFCTGRSAPGLVTCPAFVRCATASSGTWVF